MDFRQEIETELGYSMKNFDLLVELLRESDPSILQKSSNEGDWTIIDVLRHIQHSEKGVVIQIQQVLKGGEGFPANFDLNRYNDGRQPKMSHLSLDEVVDKMEENRKKTLEVLDAMRDGDWVKRGNFANQKEYSVKTFFKTLYHHQNNHINQIREVLNK